MEKYYDPNIGSRGHMGSWVYKCNCERCGKTVVRINLRRDSLILCEYCQKAIAKKKKMLEIDQTETKCERRFKQAVKNIKSQVNSFSDYESAINIAKTKCECYGSIPEAMVAIELIKLKYSIIPQQKISKYKVDFALPKQKMILEVDGTAFHKNKYNGDREAIIQLALGTDWKIIHINAELIAKDIKKLKEYMIKASDL